MLNNNYNFPKEQRLKSRKQIEQLFAEGKQFSVFPFKVFWLPVNKAETLQVAVAVSSRNFKKATDRNRIKRQMREAWRLQKNKLDSLVLKNQQQFSVFILYTGKELPAYSMVSGKIKLVIERLIKTCNGASEKNI
ncbi:MAG: ribonuclease P protein component [Ferruginibacter sp.]